MVGIEMTEYRLYEENSRKHFMTKVFDSEADEEKHQTLCAIGTHIPNNALIKTTLSTSRTVMQKNRFNVIARNCDDHTKNF
jgi:serine/threonine-protein kinase HipA